MITREETSIDVVHELEHERDWRIAELSKIKLLFRKIKEMEISEYLNVYLKMTIPMIYAHWEGYCVASFKILGDYIKRKGVDAKAVTFNILTYANKKSYDKLKGKSSFRHKIEFTELFIDILNDKITSLGKLDTKSNLNYKVLQEILQILGMDECDFREYEADLNELVNLRNAIAHGENSRMIDFEKMIDNIILVTELIDVMLLKEIYFIQEEAYLLK